MRPDCFSDRRNLRLPIPLDLLDAACYFIILQNNEVSGMIAIISNFCPEHAASILLIIAFLITYHSIFFRTNTYQLLYLFSIP